MGSSVNELSIMQHFLKLKTKAGDLFLLLILFLHRLNLTGFEKKNHCKLIYNIVTDV